MSSEHFNHARWPRKYVPLVLHCARYHDLSDDFLTYTRILYFMWTSAPLSTPSEWFDLTTEAGFDISMRSVNSGGDDCFRPYGKESKYCFAQTLRQKWGVSPISLHGSEFRATWSCFRTGKSSSLFADVVKSILIRVQPRRLLERRPLMITTCRPQSHDQQGRPLTYQIAQTTALIWYDRTARGKWYSKVCNNRARY